MLHVCKYELTCIAARESKLGLVLRLSKLATCVLEVFGGCTENGRRNKIQCWMSKSSDATIVICEGHHLMKLRFTMSLIFSSPESH